MPFFNLSLNKGQVFKTGGGGIDYLYVNGDSFIDFNKRGSGFFYVKHLYFSGDSVLTFRGSVPSMLLYNSIDSWGPDFLPHIAVEKDGKLWKPAWSLHYGGDHGFHYLEQSGWTPWTPLPEPATYGAIFGTVALGLAAWKRRQNKQEERIRKGGLRGAVNRLEVSL